MQFANASAPEPPLGGDGPELVADLLVVDGALVVAAAATVDAELVALLTVAAVGLCELPPHPATKAPLTSAAAVSTRARRGLSLLIGVLRTIWSPPGPVAGVCVLSRNWFCVVGCVGLCFALRCR